MHSAKSKLPFVSVGLAFRQPRCLLKNRKIKYFMCTAVPYVYQPCKKITNHQQCRSAGTYPVYLQTIVGPSGFSNDITTFTFDSVGRVHTVQDPLGYTLTFAYDAMDRLVSTTFPDSTTELTTWYLLDPVIFQDRLGRITQDTYDNMRQLIKSVDSQNRVTQLMWCSCGSLMHLTDGNGNETTWNHDVLGRTVQKVFADGSQENYVYEPYVPNTEGLALGRLSTVTDALVVRQKIFSSTWITLSSKIRLYALCRSTPRQDFCIRPWATCAFRRDKYLGNTLIIPTMLT